MAPVRRTLPAAGLVALLTLLASGQAAAQASTPPVPRKPNILVFLVDDMGWRDAGYAGSDLYLTPALDRLASDGLRFDNAYVVYPRCTPSRYGLLTGRHPARIGMPGAPGPEVLPPEEFTVAEAFHAAGYRTFFAGKWHLSRRAEETPEAQGFDINIGGGSAGAPASYFFPYRAEQGKELGPGLENGSPGEYLTDRLTDETIGFLRSHLSERPEQPFFAFVSHYAVHTPMQAKAEQVARFERALEAGGGARSDGIADRDGQTKLYQDNPTYAAMVASMDESLGRIRQELEHLDIHDDTIILFTSDHGGLSNRNAGGRRPLATSNAPLRAGKGHLYEGGLKVPMIVFWPGRTKPGQVTSEVVINTDLYPTLLDMADVPQRPEQTTDGQSFVDLFVGADLPDDRPLYWYSPRPRPDSTGDTAGAALRVGDWKFIQRYDPLETDELYDLAADPGERRNLVSEQPLLAERMRSQLADWLVSVDAVPPQLDRGPKAD